MSFVFDSISLFKHCAFEPFVKDRWNSSKLLLGDIVLMWLAMYSSAVSYEYFYCFSCLKSYVLKC